MCDNVRFREQNFGRQLTDSGTMFQADRAGVVFPVFFPTNPLQFEAELGFMGYRYMDSFYPIAPEFAQPGYQGVYPLKEQPRLDMPLPYRNPVVL